MANLSLSEIFKKLESDLKKPEKLDCGEFNLLKIFQHAFNKTIQNKKTISRVIFNYPFAFQQLYYLISSIRKNSYSSKSKIESIPSRDYVIYAGGNIVQSEQGMPVSSNSYKLMRVLGKEKCCYIYNEVNRGIIQTGQELNSTDVFNCGSLKFLDKDDINLIKQIRTTLKNSGEIYESNPMLRNNFHAQIQQFIDDYRSWKYVLKRIKPKTFFFSPHYHNEGLILACKRLHIKAVELQHGLISREDYYYSYPEKWKQIYRRALFADEIQVFGEFWKSELLTGYEYDESQIKIIGKYQYHPEVSEKSIKNFKEKYHIKDNNKIIAICCQTNSPQFYADYSRKLSEMIIKNHEDYLIIIKPHPRQAGMQIIQACEDLPNIRVTDKTENLMVLLEIAEIQISIYSTTFFDALGTGTINFSLQESANSSEYAERMVEQGIAFALNVDENPIDKLKNIKPNSMSISAESVYAPFNKDFINL